MLAEQIEKMNRMESRAKEGDSPVYEVEAGSYSMTPE